MRLSVIIPTYKRADYLPATLDSLLAQERPADEILIIDDGSPDDTPAIAARYTEAHPTVRYIRRENGGLSAARNTGQANATGDALLFIDSDDLLLPSALQRLEAALVAQPDACLAFCRAQIIDEHGTVTSPLWETDDDTRDIWNRLLTGNRLRSAGAVLIRASHLHRAGAWDESLRANEDWDMWMRLAETGAPFVRVDDPLFLYRIHSSNMSGNRPLMRSTGLMVYRKHLERHKGSPERYTSVWRRYRDCLTPEEAKEAEAEALYGLGASGSEAPPEIYAMVAQSRRHRMLRGLIERTNIAGLYRKLPHGLRLRMRNLFGINADAA